MGWLLFAAGLFVLVLTARGEFAQGFTRIECVVGYSFALGLFVAGIIFGGRGS